MSVKAPNLSAQFFVNSFAAALAAGAVVMGIRYIAGKIGGTAGSLANKVADVAS